VSMLRTLRPLLSNILHAALLDDGRHEPLFPLYHVTPYCNLRCSYCDGFPELGVTRERGWAGPGGAGVPDLQLATAGVKELLRILRRRFDYLFLSGGEPLLREDIEEIVEFAGKLGFRGISINTNALLLHEKDSILGRLATVVVSLDTADEAKLGRIIGRGKAAARTIIGNVERYARAGRSYKLVVHSVILPGSIPTAEEVLRFCLERDIWICLSPLQKGYRVPRSLESSREYARFIDEVIALKKDGKKISGSLAFYENIRDLRPFRCLPLVIPRILPDGRILYPCRPKGRVGASILSFGSWEGAAADAARRFGPPPDCRDSCRIRCYIEPSLIMKQPFRLAREFFL
jgi:MoaA/NifB/PqqE/SkfB family radical SAM enzyme